MVTEGLGNLPGDNRDQPNGDAAGVDRTRQPLTPSDRDLDDAAALVLGALTGDERDLAMSRLDRDAEFRREVAELGTVAALLPRLVLLADAGQLPSAGPTDGPNLVPSAGLRSRILDQILADAGPAPVTARTAAPSAPIRAADPPPRRESATEARRAGSVAPQTIPSSRQVRSGAPASVGGGRLDLRRGANIWLTALMAVVIVVFAVAAIALQVRNMNLTDDVDDLRTQVTALDQETVALQNEVQLANAQSNASAWVLNPNPAAGEATTAEATGTVFYSYREQSVVAEIRGLPTLDDGSVYQLWYLGGTPTEGPPRSAGLMQFTADGVAVFAADEVAQLFDAVAISVEPAGGSTAPTTTPILIGTLSAAG